MSLPDEVMKLKDGKIIYDKLASMVAVQYSEAEANPAGSYVIYNGSVYLLPNGHTANVSWANTEKEGPTNIYGTVQGLETEIDSKADTANPNFTGSISMGRADNTTVGGRSVAVGYGAIASGDASTAFGKGVTASGEASHAEGMGSTASGINAHAEGTAGTASGNGSHAEGSGTYAVGYSSHSEGAGTHAVGDYSHAEGGGTYANGNNSHAEGSTTTANGTNSHAEGAGTVANGYGSHAEGAGSQANGDYSYAGGGATIANGACSHVAGSFNIPDDYSSWDEWVASTSYAVGAKVKRTVTENNETTVTGYICKTANNDSTFDSSKWDVDSMMNYAEIVGNGKDINNRSNARTMDWDGNEELAGDLTVNKGKTGEVSVSSLQKNKAPVIIDSATGNPIVLTDGADRLPVESMKIPFNPVQDLHGYNSPWPAGGGKNIFNINDVVDGYYISASGVVTAESGDAYSNKIAVEEGEAYTLSFMKNEATSHNYRIHGYDSSENWVSQLDYISASTAESRNRTFTIPNGVAYIKISFHKDISNVQVEKGSSQTSYAPYENICPISGWQGLTAWRTGKNLLDDSKKVKSGSNIYIGTETANTPGITLPPGTYTVAFDITENLQRNVYAKDADTGVNIPGFPSYQAYSTSPAVVTFTLTKQTRVTLWTYNTSYTSTSDVISVMLNAGSTASPYTEYTGDSYPVTFPDGQTIYGGTLDAVNGVVTVEYALADFGDLKWYKYENSPYFFYTTSIPISDAQQSKMLCSAFANGSGGGAKQYFTKNGSVLRVYGTSYEDASEFKTGVTGVKFCYPIATPYEIHLDPIAVQTLLGDNTVWSDANGTIELDYRADTKLFCQKNDTVDDVQIDGTSIISNGVAIIPQASTSAYGVVKVGNGLTIESNSIRTLKATDANIKAGSDGYKPIVAYNQHKSVFYGLAKLAGADMASSSNTVGQFTDAAKVAIQKMLGVYQAPWELIREDTFTNATEADHEITVDGNGVSLQLTDAIMMFETPVQNNYSSFGSSGGIMFAVNAAYRKVECGQWTQNENANAHGCIAIVKQYNNLIEIGRACGNATVSNMGPAGMRYGLSFPDISTTSDRVSYSITNEEVYVTKIKILSVTGTGHYKLYGRRKWN